ncbi:MAG: hypothetical protein HY608_08020 [Planctomycetes bacterium]|nr:hypothetical protein [Planctomycetota bacterium]
MSPIKKGAIVLVAWLLSIFALSAGLSWYSYGYLDVPTLKTMLRLLTPILVVAVVILARGDREARPPQGSCRRSPRTKSKEAGVVETLDSRG